MSERLHKDIMNLRCDKAGLQPSPLRMAYRDGFRDARHAAAELVAASPPIDAPRPDDMVRERQRLHDLALEILAAWSESENEDDIVKRARMRTAFRDRLREGQ